MISILMPQTYINPTTPTSMEWIVKTTHNEAIGLGMSAKATTSMTPVPANRQIKVVGFTLMN
jgi:hypothetical protein